MGRYSDPRIVNAKNLQACSKALQIAAAEILDFIDISPTKDDFIYCDPPFDPLSATASFTNYTKENFGPEDQVNLRNAALEWHRSGVKVMLSNSDTDLIPQPLWIRSIYRTGVQGA